MDVDSSMKVMTPIASQVRYQRPSFAYPRRPGRRRTTQKKATRATFRRTRTRGADDIAKGLTRPPHSAAVLSSRAPTRRESCRMHDLGVAWTRVAGHDLLEGSGMASILIVDDERNIRNH